MVNKPGGLPVHYGVVRYGTDPENLNQTAKNPIRLNPYHSSTVFRVNLYNLPPKTTYYYTVESKDSSGKSDGVTSQYKPSRHGSGALSPMRQPSKLLARW
jgi:hypothetical protein